MRRKGLQFSARAMIALICGPSIMIVDGLLSRPAALTRVPVFLSTETV
jgi:hypothetical protein